ncbi:MAG: hypothetical protein WAL98_01305 [Desulfatiglandaceae bacterium]|jgi:hypothetical protein
MTDYIVCPNKRSAPRMNVLVCRERCPLVEDCPAYNTLEKVPVVGNPLALPADSEKISATAS